MKYSLDYKEKGQLLGLMQRIVCAIPVLWCFSFSGEKTMWGWCGIFQCKLNPMKVCGYVNCPFADELNFSDGKQQYSLVARFSATKTFFFCKMHSLWCAALFSLGHSSHCNSSSCWKKSFYRDFLRWTTTQIIKCIYRLSSWRCRLWISEVGLYLNNSTLLSLPSNGDKKFVSCYCFLIPMLFSCVTGTHGDTSWRCRLGLNL